MGQSPFSFSPEARVRIDALMERAEPRWRDPRSNVAFITRNLPDAFEVIQRELRAKRGVDLRAEPTRCRSLGDVVERASSTILLQALSLFSQFLDPVRQISSELIGLPQARFEAELNQIVGDSGAAFRLVRGVWTPPPQNVSTALPVEERTVSAAAKQPPKPRSRARASRRPRVDVGIMTIIDEEFEAVLDEFPDDKDRWAGRRHYNLRTADGGGGARYRIAILRHVEQGTGEAQDAARDMIDELKPRLLLVVGIAGGLPSTDFTLGDVILSTRVNDYSVSAQKENEPPSYSLGGGPIDRKIATGVANLLARREDLGDWQRGLPARPVLLRADGDIYSGDDAWRKDIEKSLEKHFGDQTQPRAPLFRSGTIASSDILVKDPRVLFPWVQSARHLLAVEMESAGVHRAARERCAMLAIRGISDIVGLKREDAWKMYAACSAAAFARAYLRTTPIPPTNAKSEGAARRVPPRKPDVEPPPALPSRAPEEAADTFLAAQRAPWSATTRRCAWQFDIEPIGVAMELTKTELHAALLKAVVVEDMRDFGRKARWPRLLRPMKPEPEQDVLPDGRHRWRQPYDREGGSDPGEDQLALGVDGRLLFQRDTFWGDGLVALDFGQFAFDLIMHAALGARLLVSLGATYGFRLTVRLRTSESNPGTEPHFTHDIVPEQQGRTAWLRKRDVSGTTTFPPDALGHKPSFVDACKRTLDRVANEFELAPGFMSTGPSFLAISRASIAAIVERIEL